MTTEDIITGVLLREGSTYTDDPQDHGGPTKYGITLRDLRTWRGQPGLTGADVAALTEAEARAIYRRRYVAQPGFDSIADPWLQAWLVDTGVLQGPRVAVKLLQKAVGVETDGVLGPITRAAAASADLATLRRTLQAARLAHLVAVALSDVPPDIIVHTQLKFLKGWIARAAALG